MTNYRPLYLVIGLTDVVVVVVVVVVSSEQLNTGTERIHLLLVNGQQRTDHICFLGPTPRAGDLARKDWRVKTYRCDMRRYLPTYSYTTKTEKNSPHTTIVCDGQTDIINHVGCRL